MIGRLEEQKELNRLYGSKESEFLALYGRRRVGKTYLVRETFEGHFTFCHTGKSDGGLRDQLRHFRKSLEEFSTGRIAVPRNWDEAFDSLKRVITSSNEKRKVVFIDELPWMDTPRSRCLSALESFWWLATKNDAISADTFDEVVAFNNCFCSSCSHFFSFEKLQKLVLQCRGLGFYVGNQF